MQWLIIIFVISGKGWGTGESWCFLGVQIKEFYSLIFMSFLFSEFYREVDLRRFRSHNKTSPDMLIFVVFKNKSK